MTTYADRTRAAGAVVLVFGIVATLALQAQTQEDSARRRLESGRAFLKARNYGEAIKDFQVVLQTYPASSVADDALLEIATYELEIAGDPQGADRSADRLLKEYSESDSAPWALVVKGRAALARGHAPEQINAAIASFDRVPRLHEGTDAVPEAMYYAGEAARVGGRRDEAIERFGALATQYPGSRYTARALLASASSLVLGGQPLRAMDQLQRLRQRFPSSPEAATALEWNTVLYRLHVRAPAQPAWSFNAAASSARIRDFRDLAVDGANHVRIATRTGVASQAPDGAQGRFVASPETRAVMVGPDGRLFTLHDRGVVREGGGAPIALSASGDDGRARPLNLEDGIVLSSGELVVADRQLRALLRFSPDGRPAGEFARQVVARRLALSASGDVAALDTDGKTVTLLDRDGTIVGRIPERGTGYQLRQPVDVAFDALGHVHVLDRAALYVFSQRGSALLTAFTLPDRSPGAFTDAQALALDAAGRLYVFDGRANLVQVYR